MRIVILACFAILIYGAAYSQGCCSGGAGSPIAGGAATGVLQKNQMELSANYQYIKSNKFFAGEKDTAALFDNLYSNYLYFRADYGITESFTMSVATGYFMNKTLVELEDEEGKHEISSGGIGDLILFPRYDIYNKSKKNNQTEITLGMGVKIPLGSHTDSNLVFSHPIVGDIYTTSPPTVQATNGSLDFMFYSFFYRGYEKRKVRVFANTLYVKKGYNSLGQKFGDFASIGVFAGKTFFRKVGVTMQVRGEWIGKIEAAQNVDLLVNYNIEKESTGGRKLFIVPQISYVHKSLAFFVTSEFPIYQYLEGTQVGSQHLFTTGLTYRFFVKKDDPLETTPTTGSSSGITNSR